MRTRGHFMGLPISADHLLFLCVTSGVLVILGGIFLFLGWSTVLAAGQVPLFSFLFGTIWNPTAYGEPSWGIASLMMGTVLIGGLSMLFAAPVGLAVAIYLSEIASKRTRRILKPLIEMIAGIPSVVLGLIGILFVAPLIADIFHLSDGLTALTAALLVGISTLPTIASISEDAISSVPAHYRDTSLALGATRWLTIARVILPAARSGITAAFVLGFGKAIGDTMIALMVAGSSLSFPYSPLQSIRPVTANIAIEAKEIAYGTLHWNALFATGFILIVLTCAIDIAADYLIRRSERYS